jgi:hypothetical protein
MRAQDALHFGRTDIYPRYHSGWGGPYGDGNYPGSIDDNMGPPYWGRWWTHHPVKAGLANQRAGNCFVMAAEGRGPLMHARIGMLQALNVNDEIRPGTLKAMIRQSGLHSSPFRK